MGTLGEYGLGQGCWSLERPVVTVTEGGAVPSSTASTRFYDFTTCLWASKDGAAGGLCSGVMTGSVGNRILELIVSLFFTLLYSGIYHFFYVVNSASISWACILIINKDLHAQDFAVSALLSGKQSSWASLWLFSCPLWGSPAVHSAIAGSDCSLTPTSLMHSLHCTQNLPWLPDIVKYSYHQ